MRRAGSRTCSPNTCLQSDAAEGPHLFLRDFQLQELEMNLKNLLNNQKKPTQSIKGKADLICKPFCSGAQGWVVFKEQQESFLPPLLCKH